MVGVIRRGRGILISHDVGNPTTHTPRLEGHCNAETYRGCLTDAPPWTPVATFSCHALDDQMTRFSAYGNNNKCSNTYPVSVYKSQNSFWTFSRDYVRNVTGSVTVLRNSFDAWNSFLLQFQKFSHVNQYILLLNSLSNHCFSLLKIRSVIIVFRQRNLLTH